MWALLKKVQFTLFWFRDHYCVFLSKIHLLSLSYWNYSRLDENVITNFLIADFIIVLLNTIKDYSCSIFSPGKSSSRVLNRVYHVSQWFIRKFYQLLLGIIYSRHTNLLRSYSFPEWAGVIQLNQSCVISWPDIQAFPLSTGPFDQCWYRYIFWLQVRCFLEIKTEYLEKHKLLHK